MENFAALVLMLNSLSIRNLFAILACVSAAGFGGCARVQSLPFANRAPRVEAFKIDYSLANAAGALSNWSPFQGSDFVTAAWRDEEPVSGPPADDRAATLNIEYPHPEKGVDSALATLKLYDNPGELVHPQNLTTRGKLAGKLNPLNWRRHADESAGDLPSEIITMEIPRAQFEMLMSDLNRDPYLEKTRKKDLPITGDVALSIQHNRQPIHHSTVAEPRLDEFIRRVYRDGNFLIGQRSEPTAIVTTSAVTSAPNPLN